MLIIANKRISNVPKQEITSVHFIVYTMLVLEMFILMASPFPVANFLNNTELHV